MMYSTDLQISVFLWVIRSKPRNIRNKLKNLVRHLMQRLGMGAGISALMTMTAIPWVQQSTRNARLIH